MTVEDRLNWKDAQFATIFAPGSCLVFIIIGFRDY